MRVTLVDGRVLAGIAAVPPEQSGAGKTDSPSNQPVDVTVGLLPAQTAVIQAPSPPAKIGDKLDVDKTRSEPLMHSDGDLEMAGIATEEEPGESATETAGGDPDAITNLLSKVARCLPSGVRPSLGFSQLVLEIGPDGALAAAPVVTSILPRLSAEETAAADRIVQAALQCGPYDDPAIKNRVISLVPDFSAIRPRVVAASVDNGPSGGRAPLKP